jgi:hypothetical protein
MRRRSHNAENGNGCPVSQDLITLECVVILLAKASLPKCAREESNRGCNCGLSGRWGFLPEGVGAPDIVLKKT